MAPIAARRTGPGGSLPDKTYGNLMRRWPRSPDEPSGTKSPAFGPTGAWRGGPGARPAPGAGARRGARRHRRRQGRCAARPDEPGGKVDHDSRRARRPARLSRPGGLCRRRAAPGHSGTAPRRRSAGRSHPPSVPGRDRDHGRRRHLRSRSGPPERRSHRARSARSRHRRVAAALHQSRPRPGAPAFLQHLRRRPSADQPDGRGDDRRHPVAACHGRGQAFHRLRHRGHRCLDRPAGPARNLSAALRGGDKGRGGVGDVLLQSRQRPACLRQPRPA